MQLKIDWSPKYQFIYKNVVKAANLKIEAEKKVFEVKWEPCLSTAAVWAMKENHLPAFQSSSLIAFRKKNWTN